MLASLEQYIILNSSELFYGAASSVRIELLVNLYGLYRGLAKISYQVPYSPEAERILFHLLAEKEWDLLSMRIHSASMKWLFQQEKICKLLSSQILQLCRWNSSIENHIVLHGTNNQNMDVSALAELVASGDNFAAKLLVYLLSELVEEDGEEHDIISVLYIITEATEMFPAASDQLCLHGIGIPIQNLYYHSRHSSSTDIFKSTLKLVFRIFSSVHFELLSDDEAWLTVTAKVTDKVTPLFHCPSSPSLFGN